MDPMIVDNVEAAVKNLNEGLPQPLFFIKHKKDGSTIIYGEGGILWINNCTISICKPPSVDQIERSVLGNLEFLFDKLGNHMHNYNKRKMKDKVIAAVKELNEISDGLGEVFSWSYDEYGSFKISFSENIGMWDSGDDSGNDNDNDSIVTKVLKCLGEKRDAMSVILSANDKMKANRASFTTWEGKSIGLANYLAIKK